MFIDATMHILRGSFTDYPEDPEYLKNVLDAAFLPYGFKVTEGSVVEAEKEENFTRRLEHQRNAYEESPRGKKMSSNTLQFYSGNSGWGTIGQWKDAPEVIQFAQAITKINDLHADMPPSNIFADNDDEKTVNIPGLHPNYRERYYWAGKFLDETKYIMTEGLTPYEYSYFRPLISLVNHFNIALKDLDMHIDVNPDWQPGQITEIPQTENSEASQEDTTSLPWQQKIGLLLQQEGDAEAIKAFPNEPLEQLENLYWDARMQNDTNAEYILEGLIAGYVASSFPFLPSLVQEKYTESYYNHGYLTPTEEEEGFYFTDEEYSYLNRLLEAANIAKLYKQKGEGEIPYFNKGENEHCILLTPVLTDMRKIATKLGLDRENEQDSSIDDE